MSERLEWYCCECLKPTSLDRHGRCYKCGSDAVIPWDKEMTIQYERADVQEATLDFWEQILMGIAQNKIN